MVGMEPFKPPKSRALREEGNQGKSLVWGGSECSQNTIFPRKSNPARWLEPSKELRVILGGLGVGGWLV